MHIQTLNIFKYFQQIECFLYILSNTLNIFKLIKHLTLNPICFQMFDFKMLFRTKLEYILSLSFLTSKLTFNHPPKPTCFWKVNFIPLPLRFGCFVTLRNPHSIPRYISFTLQSTARQQCLPLPCCIPTLKLSLRNFGYFLPISLNT
jgi:hypothetical protein